MSEILSPLKIYTRSEGSIATYFNEDDKETEVNSSQLLNAYIPKNSRPSLSFTSFRLVLQNAYALITFKEDGKLIFSRRLHSRNAFASIATRPSLSFTSFRELLANTELPITFKEAGMSIFLNPELANADSSISTRFSENSIVG